jgi:hypothetical protein
MDIVTDYWLAPKVPGYDEVRDFYRRMAEKIGWVPSGTGMLNRPDISKGMSELYKEGAKLDGIPVLQVVKMGGSVEGDPQAKDGDSSRQTSSASSPPPASLGGALSSALGGRFGLGQRKKENTRNQPEDSSSGQTSSASGSLMEMTIEMTNFSSAPADSALFEIPAGFKQVATEPMAGRQR